MKLAVWNMCYGKFQAKLDLLKKEEPDIDMAVLSEIDNNEWNLPDGKWEEFIPPLDHKSPRGIRVWHKENVILDTVALPDLSKISIARAYSVKSASGDFAPFIFVAYWAVWPKELPYDNYAAGLRDLLSSCRKLFAGDLLIAGDTNLNASEIITLWSEILPGIHPDARCLTASDGNHPHQKILGALKEPCDTLLHLGKWYPCDIGIASATLAKRVKIHAGQWQKWIKPPRNNQKIGSDHLPVFFDL